MIRKFACFYNATYIFLFARNLIFQYKELKKEMQFSPSEKINKQTNKQINKIINNCL